MFEPKQNISKLRGFSPIRLPQSRKTLKTHIIHVLFHPLSRSLMRTAYQPNLRIPRMHSARKLLHSKLLCDPTISRSVSVSVSRTFSANTPGRCSFSHHFSSSGWSTLNHTSRCSEEERDVSSETGDPREPRRVLTFDDPLEGKLITRAVEEDEVVGDELRKADESTEVENSVEKNPAPRAGKPEVGTVKEDSNMASLRSVLQPTWRKSGKVKVSWVCENCGATTGKWWGACPSCQATNTLREFSEFEGRKSTGPEVSVAATGSWLSQGPGNLVPQSLAEVNKGMNHLEWRIPLPGHFGMEVARVLGGGLVPGSLVLVGGDPGVGKSTLLLQIAAILTQGFDLKGPTQVIYVSGEESIDQIGNRADRLRINAPKLYLYSSTDIEDILEKIHAFSPRALIVDSIQTVYLRGISGSAGNVMQVKECTSALLRFAKQTNIPVLLIGHVTKTGDIAGPRMLEHIVDVVLYLEGESYSSYRLLRSVKNRFGSTDELGVFEMSESGLQAVSNPSELFLSENHPGSKVLAGLAVAVVVDGSRAFLIEVQALCGSGSTVARQVNGVPASRADMIISVLMKQAGLKLQDTSIFLNVVSGYKLTETAGDLAVAVAICSSFLEFPLPNDIAFIGEVGLGGELRMVSRMDKRISAVAKLGYRKCVIPKSAVKSLMALDLNITILGCGDLKEVINSVFQEE